MGSQTAVAAAALRSLYGTTRPPLQGSRDDLSHLPVPWPLSPAFNLLRRAGIGARTQVALDALTFGLAANVGLRTVRIDHALAEAVDAGARQLMVLGAGFDVRAHLRPYLRDVAVFEVDHPDTQRNKRALLASHRKASRDVTYVGVDFERDSLEERLRASGLDPQVPAVVLWESVMMYLSRAARAATLAATARVVAPGSRIVATYLPPDSVNTPVRRLGLSIVSAVGEPILSMTTPAQLGSELATHGFDVLEDDGLDAWAERYWPAARPDHHGWERVVVAKRRPSPTR